LGFEYFYGFMGGDTSQWQPGNLYRNTTQIHPYDDDPDYNLVTAMADDAIDYMHNIDALNPDQPFFIYYAPGATHAPHHPTPEWIEKISEMHLFDEGWHKLRDTIFANQKRLGVLPDDAKLTPWPDDLIKHWDQLSDTEKKLFIKQANVFAAYVAYTDHEIGRVIQAVEDMGKLENTLIIYITGDNGTSSEGGPTGATSRWRSMHARAVANASTFVRVVISRSEGRKRRVETMMSVQHPLLDDPRALAGFKGWSEDVYEDFFRLQRGEIGESEFREKYYRQRAILSIDMTGYTASAMQYGELQSLLCISMRRLRFTGA